MPTAHCWIKLCLQTFYRRREDTVLKSPAVDFAFVKLEGTVLSLYRPLLMTQN